MTSSHTTGPGDDQKSAERPPIPWEDGSAQGWWRPLWGTTAWCLRRPLSFFDAVAQRSDRWPALGFATILHIIGFSCAAAWSLLLSDQPPELWLVRVAIAPLWVLVAVWAGAEMMHGWLSLFRGAARPRSVTHRGIAYAYCTIILGVVPGVGIPLSWAVGSAWHVMALRQIHRVPWWKAVMAVILTWAVPLGFILIH